MGTGRLLIGLRICFGVSQCPLAHRLEIDESQVPRDERNEWRGISMARANAIPEASGVRLVTWVEAPEPNANFTAAEDERALLHLPIFPRCSSRLAAGISSSGSWPHPAFSCQTTSIGASTSRHVAICERRSSHNDPTCECSYRWDEIDDSAVGMAEEGDVYDRDTCP